VTKHVVYVREGNRLRVADPSVLTSPLCGRPAV